MKKFAILSIMFLSSLMSYSQEISGKFRIGLFSDLEFNLSATRINYDQGIAYFVDYNVTNYKFGLVGEYLLKKNITLHGGFLYSRKDFTKTFYSCPFCNNFPTSFSQKIELSFIEVPATFRIYTLFKKHQLFAETGFNNLFILKDEINGKFYTLGLKFGGGAELTLRNKFALQLILGYDHTITDTFKGSDYKIKSFNIGITLMKSL